MFSQTILDFGRKPNVIRDLSAYAGRRKAEIGAEHVFDFSIGSPNVPPPPQVHEAMLDLLTHADPVEIHSYTAAPGLLSLRKTIAQSINRRFGDHVDESGIYVTAGASGAIAMTLEMFSDAWLAAGLDPEWIHRVVTTASGGFDTVPWNSFVVLILSMGKLTHKQAYMPVFWVSLVAPILIALLGVFFV